jgi:glycosyltransferase involved in cell wall biosynthesis
MVQTLDVRTGGVARAVILLSEALAKAGPEVEIVTLQSETERTADATFLKVHALGTGAPGYGYAPDVLPWLRANRERFDAVIVNGMWQYPGLASWRAFADTETPYYVFPHGMLDPWFKRTYPLKHLKKWLYWAWAEYRILRDARAVIFTSEEERLQARDSFWLYRCRERVAPLGMEAPPVASPDEFFARWPELRGRRIVLFLGRIHPKKGCDMLIEAFARTALDDQQTTLVMAGPDHANWASTLRDLAAGRRIAERVVFTGMLEGAMKWAAFRAADVFVLPSHQENFGLSVAEALACGVPVLMSNRVNIWREVQEDGAGLIEPDDLPGTERLLRRWFETPDAEREAMRVRATECFAKRFEIGHAAASLLKILSDA